MFKKIREILYRSIEVKEISYKKAKEIIKKDKTTILLDVRSPQEYKEEHLDTAINIPLYSLEKEAENIIKNKQCTIISYCTTGHRSKMAKELLEKKGYENVYNLKNGLDVIV